uniref:Uncharacterized protein n=1 Tax=Solanum tuberosum TaxID=4113 RepID=M1D876_SOLTU
MRFKYVSKGYTKLFNVDPRRPVLKTKVGICGALGFDLVIDDGYNLNYITLEVVSYLGLPRLHMSYPYTMEGCKVTKGVKVSFTHSKYYEEVLCDIMPMVYCHLSLGANWFAEHSVPNEQNGYKCVVDQWGTHLFPLSKVKSERQKIEMSTSVVNGGTQVPAKEPTVEGTIANLNTFTITNAQSVNVSLSLCESIDSLPCVDNVLVENVDTLVDPIDDRIDSSRKIDLCPPSVDTYDMNASSLFCIDYVDQPVFDPIDDRIDSSRKIDLCPPSVDTYDLNASSLFCIDYVDQPVCKCISLVEGPCNVIKEPLVGGTNENVVHLIRSDSLRICIAKDPIACFDHRDHVLENSSKTDMCLSEGELACFNSSLVVDHSLFKYNIQFEDDEITPSDVASGVNLKSSIVFDSYTCDSNPLWCEAFPPKDGNPFFKDETLVGKKCDEEEGGVCFSVISSSWCVSLLDSMTNAFEPIGSHTHENTLEEVDLRLTVLYYLFYI